MTIWERSAQHIDLDFLQQTAQVFVDTAICHSATLPKSTGPKIDCEEVKPSLCASRMSKETCGILPAMWEKLPPELRKELSTPDENGELLGMRRGRATWVQKD